MQYILLTRANQGCPHCSYNLRHLWLLEQLRTSCLAPANFVPKQKSMQMDQNSTCRGLSLEKKIRKTNMAGWKIMKINILPSYFFWVVYRYWYIHKFGLSIHDKETDAPTITYTWVDMSFFLLHHVHLMTLESRHEKTPFRYAGTSALSLRWYVGGTLAV